MTRRLGSTAESTATMLTSADRGNGKKKTKGKERVNNDD